MTVEPSRDAIRMLDALDAEGRQLFDEATEHDGDGWGERVMAQRIASRIPDPVAMTYRQLVIRSEELLSEFVRNSWDESDHDYQTCEVAACERCNDQWDSKSVRTWLLEELARRRNEWLSANDAP